MPANNNQATLCVDNPQIEEILDLELGVIIPAKIAIGNDYAVLEKLRMELKEAVFLERDKYVCPICMVSVYLVCNRSSGEKLFYFRHSAESGNCPAITREGMSKDEIEARKYNGVKESAAHIRMKEIIAESLSCDPDFSEIKIEKVWKGQDRTKWRKPDIQALWKGGLKVVFEVQLSTTFLDVIVARRLFYQSEGALVCWIFKSFETESASIMQDDIFYNNNCNLFLASEKTLMASHQEKSLILDCRWIKPSVANGKLTEEWNARFASFSELSHDLESQRIYLFDYCRHKELIMRDQSREELRQRFELWWEKGFMGENCASFEDWKKFSADFKLHDVSLPNSLWEVHGLLNAIYTAKLGRVVGWKHKKFIQVVHTVYGGHTNLITTFRAALIVYGRGELVKSQDPDGKLRMKVNKFIERSRLGDKAYDRHKKYDGLVSFLFPDVWLTILAKESQLNDYFKNIK